MHVGLKKALCSRCMCLIHVVTRCCAFFVPAFNPPLSSNVVKKVLLHPCTRRHVQLGLLKTLGFALCRVFAVHLVVSHVGDMVKEGPYTRCINRSGLF